LFPNGSSPTLSIQGTAFGISNTGLVNFISTQTFPGAGTITGVTTTSGSGLTGGGTNGTLSLGLAKTCASKQVLQWNGSSWVCASVSGTGTVTSVGLSAPSTDFTVTGSPVTGSGTLGLNWNVAPTSSNTANAIVKRDSTGSFAATEAVLSDNSIGQAVLALSSVPNAITIYGQASATTGTGYGIKGDTSSSDRNAVGVYGYADSSTGNAKGVLGYAGSSSGIGVRGESFSPSTVGSDTSVGAGIWGDTGVQQSIAVLGTADDGVAVFAQNNSSAYAASTSVNQDGYGLEVVNDSPSGYATAVFGNAENSAPGNHVLTVLGGAFGGQCTIDVSGNLGCTGSKSAVVPVDKGTRKVALYAIEGPENWFEDAGGGQLVNGSAIVQIEPTFAQTINTEMEYRVFLTPNGDCKGLYVTQKSPASFEVHELDDGTSTIAFDYRIMAKRKGYENIRLADKTKEFEIPQLPKRPVSSKPASVKPIIRSFAAVPSQFTTHPAVRK
jgi:hypothetical protein